MTVLYLSARYTGMLIAVTLTPPSVMSESTSLTDAGCAITLSITNWSFFIANFILGVIMITRVHAMYQRSRRILVFLIVIFVVIQIPVQVYSLSNKTATVAVELVLSGIHVCGYYMAGDIVVLSEVTWILRIVWEVVVLCLASWSAVQHFRELQRPSTEWAVGNCFTALIKTHVFYFASFVAMSCLYLIAEFSPTIMTSTTAEYEIFYGILAMAQVLQMGLLGPRLILGLREYHAKAVANSDEGIEMTSIAFQERIQIVTGGGV